MLSFASTKQIPANMVNLPAGIRLQAWRAWTQMQSAMGLQSAEMDQTKKTVVQTLYFTFLLFSPVIL